MCHVIPCTCPSCRNELVVTIHGCRKPPRQLDNIARRRGWTAKPKKATYLCPEHAP